MVVKALVVAWVLFGVADAEARDRFSRDFWFAADGTPGPISERWSYVDTTLHDEGVVLRATRADGVIACFDIVAGRRADKARWTWDFSPNDSAFVTRGPPGHALVTTGTQHVAVRVADGKVAWRLDATTFGPIVGVAWDRVWIVRNNTPKDDVSLKIVGFGARESDRVETGGLYHLLHGLRPDGALFGYRLPGDERRLLALGRDGSLVDRGPAPGDAHDSPVPDFRYSAVVKDGKATITRRDSGARIWHIRHPLGPVELNGDRAYVVTDEGLHAVSLESPRGTEVLWRRPVKLEDFYDLVDYQVTVEAGGRVRVTATGIILD